MAKNNSPDLTKRPPRSPRVRLGGYVILPRMLDKGRATVAGKKGEYHYACPLDERFLEFAGINPKALKKELAKGKGDGEILKWIEKNARHKHSAPEVAAWSVWQERGNEGLMIKDLDSSYTPGKRGKSWLKMKRELATLDVVVTAVEYGH